MSDKHIISQLALPDAVTLLAVALSWVAIVLLLKGWLFASVGIAIFALIADMLDGWLARRHGVASSLGKHIDSLVDVILYLLYPALFMFVLGLSDIFSVIVLGIFIVAGILRLARFTAQGLAEDEGRAYYIGMPVFWNLLWLYGVVLLDNWLMIGNLSYLMVPLLLVVSWLMLAAVPWPKPGKYYVLIPLLTLAAGMSIAIELFRL